MQSLPATDEPIHIVNVGLRSESSEHYSDTVLAHKCYTYVQSKVGHVDISENQLLLKESDFIAFFDQFPFGDLFQRILQVSSQGESCDCHVFVM